MSKRENTSLMKTCSNCGQQKPLSAFLEMSSEQGTSYGNICSTCRKTTLDELARRKKTDAEGSTTTDIGHKIDTKAKVQGEVDKRQHIKRIDEEYHAERKEDAETNKSTDQTKLTIASKQRDHRESFLKKSSLLGTKTNLSGKQTSAQQLRTEMIRGNEKTAQQSNHQSAEELKTGMNFKDTNLGLGGVAGQARFHGEGFKAFLKWVGNAAPLVNNQNVTKQDPKPATPGAITQEAKKTPPNNNEKAKDPAVEFIENNWRPGGGRKR